MNRHWMLGPVVAFLTLAGCTSSSSPRLSCCAMKMGAVTVLLGATQAGKTSLMRVMAGLDAPSTGRVLADGQDVTGKPVRERNVSMVYQQFINYPSMTVADNIASPLKLRGEKGFAARVAVLAA